jgi:hypothetical protein
VRNREPEHTIFLATDRMPVTLDFLDLFHRMSSTRSTTMLRRALGAMVAFMLFACVAMAADKEVKGKVVKVDAKKNTITVNTLDGKKTYTINDDTKFVGPRGGASDDGIKDDRLNVGAEITLVIAGNNKTVREVRLPMREKEEKKK